MRCVPRHSRGVLRQQRRSAIKTTALMVPDAYGYVMGSIGVAALVVQWMSVKVALARRTYGVSYPAMMAEGDDEGSKTFNCIQRSHQNTLETLPTAVALQMLMGLKFPITAACMGFAWSLGRIAYALGYSTGDPAKRMPGSAVSGIIYLALIVGTFVAGYQTVF
eukprot:jgi/Picre1/31062/NNA_006418.t1